MTHPNDPEFPSSGVFECMASLIYKGIQNRDWLLRDQNIFMPYYAAHVIGSYTMNKIEFAEKAVKSGGIPLMELMRGKISWVEQRVAVRALGHLASYKTTFDSVAEYEKEIIELAMEIASICLDVVYDKFVAVKDKKKRLRYHCDLLTRGVGGSEMENVKAEEWASQLQYQDTRFKVMEISVLVLADLVEMKTLGGIRKRVGESIAETLLLNFSETKDIWDWNVERRQREMEFTEQEIEERRAIVGVMKQQGNKSFRSGNIEE
ncbi:hypothetical protein MKX01_017078, partial [Papaver californicum]